MRDSTSKTSFRPRQRWDGAQRQLTCDGLLVKHLRVPAANQEAILEAFELEGWPAGGIDNPLPPKSGGDSKEQLHGAIARLNGAQINRLLHFRGNGTGTRVLCVILEPPPPKAGSRGRFETRSRR
jgi:hypothetical protein